MHPTEWLLQPIHRKNSTNYKKYKEQKQVPLLLKSYPLLNAFLLNLLRDCRKTRAYSRAQKTTYREQVETTVHQVFPLILSDFNIGHLSTKP